MQINKKIGDERGDDEPDDGMGQSAGAEGLVRLHGEAPHVNGDLNDLRK